MTTFAARKTIITSIVGSTLHGTSVDDGLEDLDLMSVVLESPADAIGFDRWEGVSERTKPEGVRSEAGDTDHSVYGLRKWLGMACNSNPTAMLPLFAPAGMLLALTDEGTALRKLTPSIVSKKAYAAFRGYMVQQRMRMACKTSKVTRPELIERYGFDTKFAGHIIRLGIQGIELLSTGRLTLPMRDEDRKLVIDIRTGKYSLPEVDAMGQSYESSLDEAYRQSALPAGSDWAACEAFMVEMYAQHWRN